MQGTAERRQTGVAFFLVTFSWRRKKKWLAAGLPPAILPWILIKQNNWVVGAGHARETQLQIQNQHRRG